MKAFYLLLLSSLVFSGCRVKCKKPEDKPLTHDELLWLSAYKGGETLIFKSNYGIKDTIIAGSRIEGTDVVVAKDPDCDQVHHTMSVSIVSALSVGSIIKIENEHSPKITFTPTDADNGVALDVTPQNNIVVNGLTFQNVKIVQRDTSADASTQPKPWKIYFTEGNGIIRCDQTKGIYWERIN